MLKFKITFRTIGLRIPAQGIGAMREAQPRRGRPQGVADSPVTAEDTVPFRGKEERSDGRWLRRACALKNQSPRAVSHEAWG
jgi:hypothetical protein